LVQAFLKKWWVESDFKAPKYNLHLMSGKDWKPNNIKVLNNNIKGLEHDNV
jgi:hypothetical protein